MTCARYADVDIAERYVLGQMEEPEQATFEEHFFGCDECFASVQVLQQMQTALASTTPPAPASSTNTSGRVAKFDDARPQAAAARPASGNGVRGINPAWWGLAVAATLLLGLLLWQRRAPVPGADAPPTIARETDPSTAKPTPAPTPAPPQSQPGQPNQATPQTPPQAPRSEPTPAPVRPARDIGLLALVVPPPYIPLQTRGTADTQAKAFATAMARYSAKEYQAAADELRAVAEAQPDAAHVQFFLGISLLMTDKPADARRALDRAAGSGTAPFADEAHFYLAKAALQERDLPRAARELRLAVEREAGPAGEAEKLLREVTALSRRGQ